MVYGSLAMDKRQARYIQHRHTRQQSLSGAAAAVVAGRSRPVDVINVASLLRNRDPLTRKGAIKNLADMGGSHAIHAIARALCDASSEVRISACAALGRMRAHAAKAQLLDTLNDADPVVCCAAAEALGIMGDKTGLPHLAKMVCSPGPQRWRALRSLGRLSDSNFPIDDVGLAQAKRWLKRNRRWLHG